MIDIQLLRKDITAVAERLAQRKFKLDVAAFNALEAERKAIQTRTEELQSQRNSLSKQIGILKGKGEVGKFLYDDWTEDEEEDSLEKTRQNLNDKIAQLNAAIDNFSTEADRGLSGKITKLNSDMESLEADITGTGNQTEGAAEKETPTPAESR